MPKISVIMAVYNSQDYVREAVQSVLNQTLTDIELICVDDGSDDDSLLILQDFAKKDNRMQVFSHKNHGASYTRNLALEKATGEYFHILDGDDMVPLDAYEKMYYEAQKNDLDMFLFDAKVIIETSIDLDAKKHESEKMSGFDIDYYNRKKSYSDTMTGEQLFCKLSADGVYRTQASLYLMNRMYVKENNIKFLENVTHEDILFTFLSVIKAKRVKHINEQLFIRRIRPNSVMTSEIKSKQIEGLFFSFFEMCRYADNYVINSDMKKAVTREAVLIADYVLILYFNAPEEEQEKLRDNDHVLTNTIINAFASPFNDYKKSKNTFLFPFASIKPKSNIILYAAGKIGTDFYDQIIVSGYCNCVMWVDEHYDRYQKVKSLVRPVEDLKKSNFDAIIIAVGNYNVAEEIKQKLISLGVSESKIIWKEAQRI